MKKTRGEKVNDQTYVNFVFFVVYKKRVGDLTPRIVFGRELGTRYEGVREHKTKREHNWYKK